MSRKRTQKRKAKPVDMSEIKRAKDKITRKVIGMPGVTGVAVGTGPSGRTCIKVYVDRASSSRKLPKTVLGLDVVVENTGTLKRH